MVKLCFVSTTKGCYNIPTCDPLVAFFEESQPTGAIFTHHKRFTSRTQGTEYGAFRVGIFLVISEFSIEH